MNTDQEQAIETLTLDRSHHLLYLLIQTRRTFSLALYITMATDRWLNSVSSFVGSSFRTIHALCNLLVLAGFNETHSLISQCLLRAISLNISSVQSGIEVYNSSSVQNISQ